MTHALERRGSPRQALRTEAKLLFGDVLLLDARTLDYSDSGMAILTDGPIATGTQFSLRCYVPVAAARQELVAQVRAVRSVYSREEAGFTTGVAFVEGEPVRRRAVGM